MPREVWLLGLVSLFMDLSSEMIHGLLPLFMVGTLGASVAVVGWIDGVARALAVIVKVFSGVVSDWFGRRKALAVLGYGLGALSKPIFALAPSVLFIVVARVLDRFGKGIRGAPRDALIADVTPDAVRGSAYGLRQSLDAIGAFAGPLLAVGLMLLWANDFRAVFWVAVIPAVISVTLLQVFLKEPRRAPASKRSNPIRWSEFRRLPKAYWFVLGLASVVMLARFSDSFLLLRAEQGPLPLAWVPLILVAMNACYSLSSYPAGRLSDRIGIGALLVPSLVALLAANLVLAAGTSYVIVVSGAALWGLHLGLSQGVLAALVSKSAPDNLRGTAFGVFSCATGISLLIASAVAGMLWERSGPAATFGFGSLVCTLAICMTIAARRMAVRWGFPL
ncbi:MAG: MFS transporter [Pseudomonadota bacterium]